MPFPCSRGPLESPPPSRTAQIVLSPPPGDQTRHRSSPTLDILLYFGRACAPHPPGLTSVTRLQELR